MQSVHLRLFVLFLSFSSFVSYARQGSCSFYPPASSANSIHDSSILIAHAGGSIDNKGYTNSLDALDLNYQRGFRIFELDFRRTRDGAIVAVHDWDTWHKMTGLKGIPTQDEFLSQLLWHRYSPLDLSAVDAWMREHPDALMIADIKEDRMAVLAELRAASLTLERWIPEVYTREEIELAFALGFPEPILMTDWNWPDHQTVKSLVDEFRLRWVGFPWVRFLVNRLEPWLAERGVMTLVHTVSQKPARHYLKAQGADIFYTETTDIQASPGYHHVCEWLGAGE